jgi:hypothetical protein
MLKSSYQIKETMLENIIQHKNPKFIKYVLCILILYIKTLLIMTNRVMILLLILVIYAELKLFKDYIN